MSFTFQNPFAYFNNPTNSNPVGLGNLYIGLPDTDPVTPANQVPVFAVQPDGSELAIPQPVRMTAGGVLTYNGTPIQLKLDADVYAVKVTSSAGAQLFYTARVYRPDNELRNDLANGTADIGGQTSEAVAKSTVNASFGVRSIKDLPSLLLSALSNDRQIIVNGFYSTLLINQGVFYWDAGKDKSGHNGIDVFAPEAITAWAGTQADLNTLFSWVGTGVGCFVRAETKDGLNPYWAGATGIGLVSDTLSFQKCGDLCLTRVLPMSVSAGTYLGKFDFGRGFAVHCESMQSTIFRFNSAELGYCVRMHTTGVNAFGNDLKDCTIENLTGIATDADGLRIGETGFTTSCSNPKVERVTITGFKRNFRIKFCVMGNFSDILSVSGDEGFTIDSEVTCQVLNFTNFRSRLNKVGGIANSGIFVTFNTSNFESNVNTGLILITGLSGGPVGWQLNNCDLEDNGTTPDVGLNPNLRTQLYLDMNTTAVNTKGMAIEFNGGVINSPPGAYDIYAARAQNVYLKKTKLTDPSLGGFSSAKLGFSTSTNAVKIYMEDCDTIQLRATVSMYSAMPALTASSGGPCGYIYRFTSEGKTYSNELLDRSVVHVTTTDLTSFDVRGVSVIVADTTAGNLNVNSFANGINGQTLRIIKPNSPNTVTLPHNGTGTQKIFTPDALSKVLSARNGIELVCYSNVWYFSGA